jgi:hypothetical protein
MVLLSNELKTRVAVFCNFDTLKIMRTLSRDFANVATPFLFQEINITPGTWHSLSSACAATITQQVSFAPCITSLQIHLDEKDSGHSHIQLLEYATRILTGTTWPRLRHLCLSGIMACQNEIFDFTVRHARTLRILHLDNVKESSQDRNEVYADVGQFESFLCRIREKCPSLEIHEQLYGQTGYRQMWMAQKDEKRVESRLLYKLFVRVHGWHQRSLRSLSGADLQMPEFPIRRSLSKSQDGDNIITRTMTPLGNQGYAVS